jgi:hypothetical protein
MKRDLDLIRKILMACEQHEHGWAPRELAIDGFSEEQIGFHVHLLGEAGLMKVADVTRMGSSSPAALPLYIRWEGYEFLEASRDPNRWDRVKRAAASAGAMSLDVVKAVLVQAGAASVKQQMGLP